MRIHDAYETGRNVARKQYGEHLQPVFQLPPETASYYPDDVWLLDTDDMCHVHKERWVKEAVDSLEDFPNKESFLSGIHIYILNRPDLQHYNGSTYDSRIVLYAGLAPANASRTMTHYLVCHELGHVFDNVMGWRHNLMFHPNEDCLWNEYARLRGFVRMHEVHSDNIELGYVPNRANTNKYAYPLEVFAEDFRYLFGSPLAKEGGWDEQTEKEPPGEDVRKFMLKIAKLWKETKK